MTGFRSHLRDDKINKEPVVSLAKPQHRQTSLPSQAIDAIEPSKAIDSSKRAQSKWGWYLATGAKWGWGRARRSLVKWEWCIEGKYIHDLPACAMVRVKGGGDNTRSDRCGPGGGGGGVGMEAGCSSVKCVLLSVFVLAHAWLWCESIGVVGT